MTRALRRQEIELHGHPVSFYAAGSGPVLLLVHGITSSADAWRSVLPALARHFTVVAPDLLGHGGSAKPRGDYSLGPHASGLRDLAAARPGLERRPRLRDAAARRAFIHTARSLIDSAGQRVSAHDRLSLAAGMPTLLLWGDRDPMIPSAHGIAAHAAIPRSRLELFKGAGHYPFEEDPKRFVRVLRDFMGMTEPSSYDEKEIRRRLVAGAPA